MANVLDQIVRDIEAGTFPKKSDATLREDAAAALSVAIKHIEHMSAWITAQNAGYSFESLGEDMPGIRAAMEAATNG